MNNQKNEEFLSNFGGVGSNDLTSILNCNLEENENSPTILRMSNYHDLDDLYSAQQLAKTNQFKVISFNVESLSNKVDNINILLNLLTKNHITFDAICINECWLEIFGDDLEIQGYHKLFLPRKVGFKGGLVTYIKNCYSSKSLDLYVESDYWEGQFIEITSDCLTSKLLLANIYVPPRGNNTFNSYKSDFFNILNQVADNYKHIIVTGDTNADALKFNQNLSFKDYFDNLTSFGLLPVITLPTHFSTRNGTILDHIYLKTDFDPDSVYAGISIHKFSDHLPVFISIPLKKERVNFPKFIKLKNQSPISVNNLREELDCLNWSDLLNTDILANPNLYYNVFLEKIAQLKDKHLPTKWVRFKRH